MNLKEYKATLDRVNTSDEKKNEIINKLSKAPAEKEWIPVKKSSSLRIGPRFAVPILVVLCFVFALSSFLSKLNDNALNDDSPVSTTNEELIIDITDGDNLVAVANSIDKEALLKRTSLINVNIEKIKTELDIFLKSNNYDLPGFSEIFDEIEQKINNENSTFESKLNEINLELTDKYNIDLTNIEKRISELEKRTNNILSCFKFGGFVVSECYLDFDFDFDFGYDYNFDYNFDDFKFDYDNYDYKFDYDDYNFNNFDYGNFNYNFSPNNKIKTLSEAELLKKLYDKPKPINLQFENIKSVDISVIGDNVDVKRGGDVVTVNCDEWTKDEYKWDVKDGKLTFYFSNEYQLLDQTKDSTTITNDWVNYLLKKHKKPINPNDPSAQNKTVYITIPDSIDLKIDEVIGNAKLTDCSINNFNFNVATGDITLRNCTINSCDIDLATGIITLADCEIGNFDVDTACGDININKSEITECNIDLASSNITFENNQISNLKLNFTDGNFTSKNCKYNMLYVDSTSGSIKISGGSADEVKVDVNSSNVNLDGISGVKKYNLDSLSDINLTLTDSKASDYAIKSNSKVNLNGKEINTSANNGKERQIDFDSLFGILYIGD